MDRAWQDQKNQLARRASRSGILSIYPLHQLSRPPGQGVLGLLDIHLVMPCTSRVAIFHYNLWITTINMNFEGFLEGMTTWWASQNRPGVLKFCFKNSQFWCFSVDYPCSRKMQMSANAYPEMIYHCLATAVLSLEINKLKILQTYPAIQFSVLLFSKFYFTIRHFLQNTAFLQYSVQFEILFNEFCKSQQIFANSMMPCVKKIGNSVSLQKFCVICLQQLLHLARISQFD